MEIMKFLVVFTFVIALNIAIYLGVAILSNMLFHQIYRNKFELFTRLQNRIIDSGKENVIRKSIKYSIMLLFFIIISISKGFTIYSMVIMGIVVGVVSPIILNDKEEILYKQIHFHKGLFFASENSPLLQIKFLTPRWGILFGPLQAFDVFSS